jgi:hypothetical protein
MIFHSSPRPASALRVRMIEDMSVRGFSEKTRNDYIRNVRAFAAFIGRSPETATAEDLRRFQLHQTQSGMQPPSINSAVSALRFFFVGFDVSGLLDQEIIEEIEHVTEDRGDHDLPLVAIEPRLPLQDLKHRRPPVRFIGENAGAGPPPLSGRANLVERRKGRFDLNS